MTKTKPIVARSPNRKKMTRPKKAVPNMSGWVENLVAEYLKGWDSESASKTYSKRELVAMVRRAAYDGIKEGINVPPETGNHMKVLQIVRELGRDSYSGMVSAERVFNVARRFNISEWECRVILDDLLRKTGNLWEPKRGFVVVVKPRLKEKGKRPVSSA